MKRHLFHAALALNLKIKNNELRLFKTCPMRYHEAMRKRSFMLVVLATSLALLCSCVVSEKLTLNSSLSAGKPVDGKSHVDLSVDDFFVGVVEDLSNWSETDNNDPIIDVAVRDFVTNLQSSKTTGNIRFIETGHNTYMGDFTFSDFKGLLIDLSKDVSNQSIVTLSEKDGRTHVEININMDNFEQLTKIIPFLGDPNFEVYGPLYNNDLTKEEYLEMVSFILGEQCPDSIAKSSVKIQVVAPKAIVSHNGKTRNTKTVEFSFPLIDFLLLHDPIRFYLEY